MPRADADLEAESTGSRTAMDVRRGTISRSFAADVAEVVQPELRHFFRHFLHDANTGLHAGGDRPLRRRRRSRRSGRHVSYYCRLGQTEPEGSRGAKLRPISAPTLVVWGRVIPSSALTSPSPSATTYPTSTAWSASPTRRTGCITTRLNASTVCCRLLRRREIGNQDRGPITRFGWCLALPRAAIVGGSAP